MIYPFILGKIGIEAVGIMAIMESISGPTGWIQSSFIPSKIKFLSEYYTKQNWEKFNKVILNSMLISILISLVLGGSIFIVAGNFDRIFNVESELLYLAIWCTIITGMTVIIGNTINIGEDLFMAIQRYDIYNGTAFIVNVIRVSIIILMLSLNYNLLALLIVNGLSLIFRRIILLMLSFKYIPDMRFSRKYFDKNILFTLFNFSKKVFIISISVYVTRHFSKFVIGSYMSMSNVAIYYTSYKIYEFIRSLPLMLQSALLPAASYLDAIKDRYMTDQIIFRVTKYAYIIFFIVSVPLFFSAKNILNLWVGPEFVPYTFVVQILLFQSLISICHSALSNVVLAKDDFNFSVNYSVMLGILSMIFLFLLIKPLGLTGVALALVLPYALLVIYFMRNALRIVDIKALRFLNEVYTPIIMPAFSIIISSFLISKYFLINSWIDVFLFFVANGAVFIIIYTVLSLNESEKKDIKTLLKFAFR